MGLFSTNEDDKRTATLFTIITAPKSVPLEHAVGEFSEAFFHGFQPEMPDNSFMGVIGDVPTGPFAPPNMQKEGMYTLIINDPELDKDGPN